jgi:inorganic pyrophosphatase
MKCTAVIEIPKGGRLKYEIQEDGTLELDRVLPRGLSYPANYGYITDTRACDGDALDVLILADYPLHIGCHVECRPIGVLVMSDEKGLDEKIIAVPSNAVDESYDSIWSIGDVSSRTLKEIQMFFEMYKTIDAGRWTRVEQFKGVAVAEMLVEKYTLSE